MTELATKPLQPAQAAAVRDFLADFCRDLPQEARGGLYRAVKGDRFAATRVLVPDGRYRVMGSDWVLGFERGKFLDAVRAVPPDFGGAGVVEI